MSFDYILSLFSQYNLNISFGNISFGALCIPVIAACIGWFTNYIAIKMLFHPRNRVSFLGLTFHGVFPKRQAHLAIKLGELFAEKLGVQNQIENSITSLIDLESLKSKLVSKVSEGALEYLQKEMPFLLPMLPEALLNTLSEKIGDKLFVQIKSQVTDSIGSIRSKVDIKNIVEKEINLLNPNDLEDMLKDLLKKEFKFIELSGAILGFFIGCIQLALTPFI